MNTEKTIVTAPQTSNALLLLPIYRNYVGKQDASISDLFSFLTNPTPQREEFISVYTTCNITVSGNIVQPNYNAI